MINPAEGGDFHLAKTGDFGVAVDRGFARVVKFEGNAETGWVCLHELVGTEAELAAKDLELSLDDWCAPLDE